MAEIEVARSLLDDVRQFIREKWKRSACELCDTDLWAIYPDPNTFIYLVAAGGPGMFQPYPHSTVPYLPVSCVNCGNLRLVDAGIFEKWRAEKATRTR
jgi:RNase P subunit RPR2